MTQLHAQPYNISATGFYFETVEEFDRKAKVNRNRHGQHVEEYEIQFMDGEDIDCALAKAWGVNQANLAGYFSAVEDWDEHSKQIFIIAVDEVGYSFDPESVSPDDFDMDIYHLESMKALAEQFVEEGLLGDIPDHLASYINMDAIAHDLGFDYVETSIAGERLIYRAG
ncbi:MAG: antirestriction protein ArdA [Rhodobiaceae bacterium]|nr:antirestriction protein ArdA [Rhodobiaceae bacterium]